MANIAQGEAECCICQETLIKSCILSYKRSGSALSVLLYFTLKDVLTEDIPLKFNISLSMIVLSLSTLVLNSRDRYEKKWQLNFTRLKTRLRISKI